MAVLYAIDSINVYCSNVWYSNVLMFTFVVMSAMNLKGFERSSEFVCVLVCVYIFYSI